VVPHLWLKNGANRTQKQGGQSLLRVLGQPREGAGVDLPGRRHGRRFKRGTGYDNFATTFATQLVATNRYPAKWHSLEYNENNDTLGLLVTRKYGGTRFSRPLP
jgi:hypothetical protein